MSSHENHVKKDAQDERRENESENEDEIEEGNVDGSDCWCSKNEESECDEESHCDADDDDDTVEMD